MAILSLPAIASAADPAVLFHPEVARVLAFQCNRCHGESGGGGLDTRSHKTLLAGGNLGPAVTPGDPDRSLLAQLIEGRRGPEHRMPLHAKPLPDPTIATIRQWIAEGARENGDPPKPECLVLPDSLVANAFTVRFYSREDIYVRVRVTGAGRLLHREERQFMANQSEEWKLRRGTGWPNRIAVAAEIVYGSAEGSSLQVDNGLATRAPAACPAF